MRNLQVPSPFADTGDDVMQEAGGFVEQELRHLADTAGCGIADALAKMISRDPLTGEQVFKGSIDGFARALTGKACEMLDDHGEYPEVDGRTCRRAGATPGQAMTLSARSNTRARATVRHRAGAHPSTGRGRPRPDREFPDAGGGPAVSSLVRLTAEAGRRFEEGADDLMAEEDIHPAAVAVMVSAGGVMLRMHAEAVDGKAVDAGWREACCSASVRAVFRRPARRA